VIYGKGHGINSLVVNDERVSKLSIFYLLRLSKIFRANGKRDENSKSGMNFDRDTSYSVQMPRQSRLDMAK